MTLFAVLLMQQFFRRETDLHFHEINPRKYSQVHTSQNTTRPERRGNPHGFDLPDPKQLACRIDTGHTRNCWYDIATITGLDRGLYKSEKTGVYEGDPIRLTIVMGDREQISISQIINQKSGQLSGFAKGTRLRLKYPTDGLTFRGTVISSFSTPLRESTLRNDPTLYKAVADAIKTKPNRRVLKPESWHHWVIIGRPRPRILKASVNGPYVTPGHLLTQTALWWESMVENVKDILKPIAERAWQVNVSDSELTQITNLVRSCQDVLGETEAFKEGMIAILASPAFLLVNE